MQKAPTFLLSRPRRASRRFARAHAIGMFRRASESLSPDSRSVASDVGDMPCGGALSTLISIVISGKVRDAQWPLNGVNAGDDVTLSFLAEPDVLVRNIAGQGTVQDGIAPYKVCSDGFAIDFGSSKS